jgi:hypothetical protein
MSATRDAGLDPGVVSIQDIRHMRRAADVLSASADWHRAQLVSRLAIKRYTFTTGAAARRPAAGCLLLWRHGVAEPVDVGDELLADRLSAGVQFLVQHCQGSRTA